MAHSRNNRFKKKNRVTRRVRRVRRRGRSIMSRPNGPWLVLGFWVLLVVAAVCAAVFLIVPMFSRSAEEPAPTMQIAATPENTVIPYYIQTIELGALQKEINPGVRYVGSPVFFEETLVFSGGTDGDGNPLMKDLYVLDTAEGDTPQTIGIQAQNTDIFSICINENWIVYTDGSRDGAGSIYAYDRAERAVSLVKNYYAGQPELALTGNTLCWIERTGTYMDKLYVCDLITKEAVTVTTFENSPYGQSTLTAANGVVMWADEDPDRAYGEGRKSVIYKLDLQTGETAQYAPGVYVHDPMTNGTDVIWMDSAHGENAKLYFSKDGGEPAVIAENVLAYGISEKFFAYNVDEHIYVYFIEDGYEQIITPIKESAMLAGVSSDKVIWYEMGISSKDVLKFATIS